MTQAPEVEKPYLVLPLNIERKDDTVAYRADYEIAVNRAKDLSLADGMTYGVYFIVQDDLWELRGIAYRGKFFGTES